MLSLPVLAAGAVGIGLGATVAHFWHLGAPTVPVKVLRGALDVLRADLADARGERDAARAMMAALRAELEREQRIRAEVAEAAASWMQRPVTAYWRAIPDDAVVLAGTGLAS